MTEAEPGSSVVSWELLRSSSPEQNDQRAVKDEWHRLQSHRLTCRDKKCHVNSWDARGLSCGVAEMPSLVQDFLSFGPEMLCGRIRFVDQTKHIRVYEPITTRNEESIPRRESKPDGGWNGSVSTMIIGFNSASTEFLWRCFSSNMVEIWVIFKFKSMHTDDLQSDKSESQRSQNLPSAFLFSDWPLPLYNPSWVETLLCHPLTWRSKLPPFWFVF